MSQIRSIRVYAKTPKEVGKILTDTIPETRTEWTPSGATLIVRFPWRELVRIWQTTSGDCMVTGGFGNEATVDGPVLHVIEKSGVTLSVEKVGE